MDTRPNHRAGAAPGARYILASYAGAGLPPERASALVDDLVLEMPHYRPRAYFGAKPEALSGMDWLVTARDARSGRHCAYLGACWLPYGAGTVMLYSLLVGERQQRGPATFLVLGALFGMLADQQAPPFQRLILKTAHPRSYLAMERFDGLAGSEFFPNRRRANGEQVRRKAQALAALLHPASRFDAEHGVIHDAALGTPNDFYQAAPTSSDASLNRLFAQRVGLDHRMLCILEFGSAAARLALCNRFQPGRRGECA